MMQRRRVLNLIAGLALLAVAAPALAQKPAAAPADQTASQFYLAYRAAFQKAKKIEDILPYMSKSRRAQIEATPAAERAEMFEMVKTMDTYTQVKVLKETKTATGATVTVEGIDSSDKSKASGTITLVKEDGAWKLDKESWSHSS